VVAGVFDLVLAPLTSGRSTRDRQSMADVLQYEEEATRRLLAVYVTPDVAAQRAAFLRALAPQRDERVIDIGVGPGLLAALIADAVGTEGRVCVPDAASNAVEPPFRR
jgi:tRNA A58 N-methylase Trm61